MKKHTLYTSIFASAIILAGSLFFSACSDEEIIDSPSLVPTGEGIFFGTSIGNGSQWAPDVIGRSAKEEKQKPLVIEGEDGFSITATVEDGIKMRNNEPKPQSRGTQVTQAANVKAFDVAAYKNVNNAYEHYFTETVTDGVNPSEKRFWPSKGTVDFIATYPQGIFNEQFPTGAEYTDGFSFNYTVKDNVEEQEDIMVAWPKGLNNGENGEAVDLQFQHLLAAVQFKVGKMQLIKINSLSIEGVSGGIVTMTYNNENSTWSYSATNTSTSYNIIYLDEKNVPNIDTSGLAEGKYITNNDNGLMMLVMPQALGANQKITLNYTELITQETQNKEIIFKDELAHEWIAGRTTTYILNIDTEVASIEIPSPPDADAHYVRIDMNYDLSGLKTYTEQGIIISNIKAQARWLDNGTNTASKDKQNIFMRTDLTPTQAKGYFANELWEIEYSVNEDGTKTYTKGAEDAPERTDNNILGESVISSLTPESYGSIYLFLDENNGNTDRQGELVFTADVTQGGSTKNVTIGKGTFKQLCPSWNPNYVGVERFENDNLITNNYPFGFCYNRVISYTNGQAVTYDRLLEYSEFLAKAYRFILWLFGALVDDIIPNTEGMAKDFVAIEYTSDGDYIRKITFNFGALNQLDELTDSSNGLNNTMVLFNYTGGVDLADLETQFDKTLSERTKTEVV